MDEDEFHPMLQLISILYTQGVFKEFRRPVIATYPELAQAYLEAIPEPQDLGSLLLKVMKRTIDREGLRKGLIKTCENALKFNESHAIIGNIARHLFQVAKDLYEEIFHRSFLHRSQAMPASYYREQRFERCEKIKHLGLTSKEIWSLREILKDFPLDELPQYAEVLGQIQRAVDAVYDQGAEHRPQADVTLAQLLAPLLPYCQPPPGAAAEAANSAEIDPGRSFSLASSLLATPARNPAHYELFDTLEDLLGVYVVLLAERSVRGSALSSYWSTPPPAPASPLLYYPLERDAKKRVSWWPCALFATRFCADSTADSAAEAALLLPLHVSRQNAERLRGPLLKELLKTRPRCAEFAPLLPQLQ
eukprot:gene41793-51015_t